MSETSKATPAHQEGSRAPFKAGAAATDATIDIIQVLRRQFWLISSCACLGMFGAVIYWANAEPWYESRAKMLVTLKDPRGADGGQGGWDEKSVQDDSLANHMEIARSRQIVTRAMLRGNFDKLPSIQSQLKSGMDPVEYVISQLSMSKGGSGDARHARSLNITFKHTDPDEAVAILDAIVKEYEAFLGAQISRVMTQATYLIKEAQIEVDNELVELQQKYIDARKNAPVIYQGEGTSNVYLEKFRRLQQEMIDVEIERSSVIARLTKVEESIAAIDHDMGSDIEKLALIDTASLERLAQFAGIGASAVNSADFQANQPVRMQQAQAKLSHLLMLQTEREKLVANFAENHPEVQNLERQIAVVQETIRESEMNSQVQTTFETITPQVLLSAYLGFLKHDLSALDTRLAQLLVLSEEAELSAKQLVEFELRDQILRAEIDRKQLLYDGIVEQVRNMDTASGMSGYMHEVLESPQPGKKVWPSLAICLAGGTLVGLMFGLVFGTLNDQNDKRFRSMWEISSVLDIPVVGQVDRIRRSRRSNGSRRVIVNPQSPEAESFRLLRTVLLNEVKSGKIQTVSVTSCQSQDGKSMVMSNLGVMFAELGIRTVIVDGDMRAPTVNRFFELPLNNGLSEVLNGKLPYKDAIKSTFVDNLFVMSAGAADRNPAELLQSETFDKLLVSLKKDYDLIIVDSGPVLLVSDPTIVAQKCDVSFIVIRPAANGKRKIQEAIRRLQAVDSNIRGCIVNTYGTTKDFANETGYQTSYSSYYYGNYGRRVKELPDSAKRNGSSNGNGHGAHHNGTNGKSSRSSSSVSANQNGSGHHDTPHHS